MLRPVQKREVVEGNHGGKRVQEELDREALELHILLEVNYMYQYPK